MTVLLVALGGALGAVARFVVDGEIKQRRSATWPLGTWLINLVGSFVLGGVLAAAGPGWVITFIATGLSGAFTTFSTASVETVALLRSRRPLVAAAYAVGTLVSCWLACLTGAALAA